MVLCMHCSEKFIDWGKQIEKNMYSSPRDLHNLSINRTYIHIPVCSFFECKIKNK